MGLDQHLYSIPADAEPLTVKGKDVNTIMYWRKHAALQVYMEQLWINKESADKPDGPEGRFNQVDLPIDADDLDEWQRLVEANNMPDGSLGGYIVVEGLTARYAPEDLIAIAKAREELAAGRDVYYVGDW